MVGPFLREYVSRHEDMDDDDDEMGLLYTGLGDTRVLARTMLEDWETEPAVYDDDQGETTPNCHPVTKQRRGTGLESYCPCTTWVNFTWG